jgi:hypothetical protein
MARKTSLQFKLMVSEALRLKIEKAAEKNGTTANAEAVARIEASFRREDTEALVRSVADRMSERFLAAASDAARRDILDEETFEADLQALREIDPDTPHEKHVMMLREMRARRFERRRPKT